ncbi:MAG: D-alanyl-D-alanine carboxypeptidase, partial [Gallionella sp.]|nr:D-alanyl-D-alanine carboxypeptidase [Gallionella sp.]
MKPFLFLIVLILPAPCLALPPQMPAAPLLAAKSYVLYDFTSEQILVSQNGDARMEPASLTKLMTAYLAFDAIKHGTIAEKQNLTVPVA